jgi:hypothetical protein
VGAVPGVELGLQAVALGQQGGVLRRQVGTMASKPAQKAALSTPVPGSTCWSSMNGAARWPPAGGGGGACRSS